MSLDHFSRSHGTRLQAAHLEALTRMAAAAGFATASQDEFAGDDDASQSPFLKARTLRLAQVPDAPAPRAATAHALVVVQPRASLAASTTAWLSAASWRGPAQSALRSVTSMFGRGSVPA